MNDENNNADAWPIDRSRAYPDVAVPDDAGDALVRPGMANRAGAVAQTVTRADVGRAFMTPIGDIEAGSWQTLTLTYTAGKFGIDDSGALRICWRFAADHTKPQFKDPKAPGFTRITASNNAVLDYWYDMKANVRPFDRTLAIRVVDGYLREGDAITVVFGDMSEGSPGMRMQTFCESRFEFRVLVDPVATFSFQPVPDQPFISIRPAPPHRYVAHVPTLRRTGQKFSLKIKNEDVWGNPTDKVDATLKLKASRPVAGLPDSVRLVPGHFYAEVPDLSVETPGDVDIFAFDETGAELCRANVLRIEDEPAWLHYWADLHGQSAETIGTGSAEQYFAFARDRAFVDACCHQGNDFQMTNEFWNDLNRITARYDVPGEYVAIPGYEWSGNTGMGGDRNVMFPKEGRIMRRSHHALIENHDDLGTDCHTAGELFEALAEAGEWDTTVFAHCGGRYADIEVAHDGRFEKAVEIHSSWGTFEWLLHDAFRLGYRVGIVANSDGHKGRPGASYPGVSMFGAIGGLTCYLTNELSRPAILDAIAHRRCYGTTGGPHGRLVMDVSAHFDQPAMIYHDDPKIMTAEGTKGNRAIMGDIVALPEGGLTLNLDILASAPIERVEVFNGEALVETFRTYTQSDLGQRVRVVWEGAKYRGRFRQVIWDGSATLTGARADRIKPINFFNPARQVSLADARSINWQSVTTGNFAGFDMWLDDASSGMISISTDVVSAKIDLASLGLEDTVFDASGVLPVFLKVCRLPNQMTQRAMKQSLRINDLAADRDNPLYIRITQTDGVRAWSSPIYVARKAT